MLVQGMEWEHFMLLFMLIFSVHSLNFFTIFSNVVLLGQNSNAVPNILPYSSQSIEINKKAFQSKANHLLST